MLQSFQTLWKRFFAPIQPLPAGIYSYQSSPAEPIPYKLHLRVNPDRTGILIVNASTVIHLNQTATEYIFHWIDSSSKEKVISTVSARYRIDKKTVEKDFDSIKSRIDQLISTQNLDPEIFLDIDRNQPFQQNYTAPFRLDCALTYRTNNINSDQAGPKDRVKRELTNQEWKTVLKKAWDAGIPHVIFTGGEPTLRPDLAELVEYVESLGMVAGLITDGLRLSEKDYLHTLLFKGLDHIMLILDPQEEQAWESVKDVLVEDISLTVHLTLKPNNKKILLDSISRLQQLGVTKISLSASHEILKNDLLELRDVIAENGFTLVWNLPVPFTTVNPIAIELQEAGEFISGAGKAWIYLEPDSDVLPEQGATQVWGNLLMDSWEKIWANAQ